MANKQTTVQDGMPQKSPGTAQKIHQQAESLAELLQNSEEYLQYCSARDRLQEHGDSYDTLAELRRHEVQLHFASMIGEDISDDIEEFNDVYSAFCLDPVVSEFLYAEGRFSHLLLEVQNTLMGKMNMWDSMLGTNNTNLCVN